MPEYVIQHNYSNGAELQFSAGQTVDLDEATAAWLEHDSPGILGDTTPEPVDEPEAEAPAVDEQAVDEQAVDEPEVDEPEVDEPEAEAPKAKRTRAKA
jgi:hypothetical protein